MTTSTGSMFIFLYFLLCPAKVSLEMSHFKHKILPIFKSTGKMGLNKPAAQAAGQTLPNATPPVGKIHPFSKIAVTFEPIQRF